MGTEGPRKARARAATATLVLACFAAVALPATPAQAAGSPDFAGVHVTDGFETTDRPRRVAAYTAQAQNGLRVARVWFYWSAIELRPGKFDFSRYDALVEDAARAGVRVLPVLIDPPEFRTSAPPGPQRGTYPPAQASAMADFAAVVVGRYGRGGAYWDEHPSLPRLPVRSWQVWNEPNIWPWWGSGPDPAAYTQLARVVGAGIRRCDPDAEIVAAGLPSGNAPGMHAAPYAEGMYAAGAKDVFDTMAVHPYGETDDDVLAQVAEMRGVMAANGDPAPMWITEFGWGTGGPPTVLTVSRTRQADLIGQTVRALHSRRGDLGVRGFVYYQWADGIPGGSNTDSVWFHVGLVDPARVPKPALARVKQEIESMGLEPTRADPAGARAAPAPCRLTPERIAPPATPGAPGAGGGSSPVSPLSSGGGANGGGSAGGHGVSYVPASPVLAAVKLSPRRFRAARSGAPLRPAARCGPRAACGRTGSRLSFRANRPGTLELRIRRVKGRRARDVRGIARSRLAAGPGELRLLGRLDNRTLRPGSYQAILQLVGRDGRRSHPATRPFTVVR